jgi:hypothetical protein
MCDCIKMTNDGLKEHPEWNTQVLVPITFSMKNGGLKADRLAVATEKLDDKKRQKPITLFASYCPFCGEKYPEAEKEEEE